MHTPPLNAAVRVLHLEDDVNDQRFVREMLETESLSLEFAYAATRRQFDEALREHTYDLIISDFSLPSYDGKAALALARTLQPDAAFIFFSGTIGEEVAVESLKIGATDYVLKQRPHRLVAAVRRAIEETSERRHRREAEIALRKSEERFRIVSRATHDVIWDWDLGTNEVWRNESFSIVLGYDPAPAVAMAQWREALHDEDRARVLSSMAAVIATGGSIWYCEYRLRRADGTYAHVYDRAHVVYDEARHPLRMIGVMIDMSDRKQAEEKIREQAALVQKAQDAFIVCDLENQVVFWNPAAERLYGWSAAEVLGRPLAELLFADAAPVLEEIEMSLDARNEWLGELHQQDRHGRPVFVQSSWTLVHDDAGQPKSKLMINTDLTAKRQLEEQLIRAQRLESLGILVSGIAHDLNNALAPVLMGTCILESFELPNEARDIIKTIGASARRGADMVSQVLTFARGGSAKMSPIRLDQLVKEMGKIIADTFPRTIRCHVDVPPGSWLVTAAATQIHQVLMNLCINARDAMEKGGDLRISMQNVVLDEAAAAAHPGISAGSYLCLAVADTGSGIPADQLKLIFQPFHTTKAPGKGTGLGLSTSQTILKNHGGFLTVESAPGEGATFKAYLPAMTRPEPATAAQPLVLPAGNGEGILVVDDEVAVLAVVKASLENYNYRVHTAASGAEAVTLFAERHGDIQLVIADMAMPFMDGAATITALRKLKPDVIIIAASGMAYKAEADKLQPHAFLHKPLTVEKLLLTTHRLLNPPT